MKTRKKCEEKGHRWVESMDGFRPPYQFCRRWFCEGARVDPKLPKAMRHMLEKGMPHHA